MVTCRRCGLTLPPHSRFCSSCGAALRRGHHPASPWWRRRWLIAPASLLGLFVVLLPPTLYVWAGLPSTSNLATARLPLSTRIFDRTETVLLAEIHQGSDRRQIVPLSQIAPSLQHATVDVEDRTFYQHHGLNLGRMARALIQNLLHRRIEEGGSTITQQVAKNLFLSNGRSLIRKLDEAILALEIDRQYSKAQILEAYLNRIYYGNQSYGAEAASKTYFGKSASQLTLPESALLAGLPQAPSDLDPYVNFEGARARQRLVLDAMVRNHSLTREQADAAFASKIALRKRTNQDDVKAPHFVHWVAAQLEKTFGQAVLETGGLTVVTSLDMRLQTLAEQTVRQQVMALRSNHVTDGALVALDPRNGEVLAMVGSAGPDVPGGEYNMAVIKRQPGSAFKLFTYSAAIESKKFTMASMVLDRPVQVRLSDGSLYTPRNYSGRYHGWIPLPYALGNSLNIPAVRVELETGIEQVVETARRMGVTTLDQPARSYQASLTLGGYEVPLIDMAAGASTLAAGGVHREPQRILRIVTPDGRLLHTADGRAGGRQAVSAEVAFIMSDMLSDDRFRAIEFGRGTELVIPGHRVAAKTGTTNDFRDNLTLGYVPDLAVGVWVGNADHSPMVSVTGIVGAAPIFQAFMRQALSGVPDRWYQPPAGLTALNLRAYTAYLLPGTEQAARTAPFQQPLAIGPDHPGDDDD